MLRERPLRMGPGSEARCRGAGRAWDESDAKQVGTRAFKRWPT